MTNEELAVRIQAGEKKYVPVLWEQIRRLIVMMAGKYARMEFIPRFVDIEDFTQCGYFAMLKAIKWFQKDGDYRFTTYLNYAMKSTVRDMLGLQNGYGTRSPLAVSLNEPINHETDMELIDLIPDETIKISEDLERKEIARALREEIALLPSQQAYIVLQHWYHNQTYTTIAATLGVSGVEAKRLARHALHKLGRSRRLLAIFLAYYSGAWYIMTENPIIERRLAKDKEDAKNKTWSGDNTIIF